MSLVERYGHLLREEVVSYDLSKYNFRDMMQRMFDYQDLEHIHMQHEDFLKRGPVAFEADQSTPWHKTFYSSPLFNEFVELYQRFVKEVIAPMIDEAIVFQTKPTFRIHLPGNVAAAQKHKDADYHHADNEINFWVPSTKVIMNNGFFLESEPGKEDFHHIPLMKPGQMLRFWGHQCIHYNEINPTDQTRISFDLRVIPYSLWKPGTGGTVKSGLTFTLGSYYTLYEKDKE